MSRYAEAHKDTTGPGDARPTGMQILEDEQLVGKLPDKIFLVTGVGSGLGVETLRVLYASGAHVYGTVRSLEKAQKVVEDIQKTTKGGKISLIHMDNNSLASVKKAAGEFLQLSGGKLNLLVENTGVMACPQGKTADGFEMQFGVNHLAHFYFFELIKNALLASATPAWPSKVVILSSQGHRDTAVRFDDIHFEKPGSYDPWLAYGQSKTANIWMATEIERRYAAQNLHAIPINPGGIDTGIMQHVRTDFGAVLDDPAIKAHFKSVEQGVATTIYAALSADWRYKGGRYLACCDEPRMMPEGTTKMDISCEGPVPHAYDAAGAARLWTESLRMVGLKEEQ